MKKITYLFILIAGLPAFMLAQCPGAPPVGFTCIPDINFEERLIALGFDNSDDNDLADGLLDNAEAASLTGDLVLNNRGVVDFTGIEAFTGISSLNINDNIVTTPLDLTANTLLTAVTALRSELTSIDVTGLTALSTLNLRLCKLTSLDVSTNTALTDLNVRDNQITGDLDLKANTLLTTVDCSKQSSTGAAPFLTLTNVDMSGADRSGIVLFNSDFNGNVVCVYVDDALAGYLGTWTIDAASNFCTGSLGTEDRELSAFSMYPNPARNYVMVTSKTQSSILDVYSISGKLVLTKELSFGDNSVNVSALSSGIYITRFTSDNRSETKKLVIN